MSYPYGYPQPAVPMTGRVMTSTTNLRVELPSGGWVTVCIDVDPTTLSDADGVFITNVVELFDTFAKTNRTSAS